MATDSVVTAVNLSVKDLKTMLNTEIFGPTGPVKPYRGTFKGLSV